MNKTLLLGCIITAGLVAGFVANWELVEGAKPTSQSEADLPLELTIQTTLNGIINPQVNAVSILFFGDTLCKIEGGNSYLIKFGMQTTVKHDDQSCTGNGEKISLEGSSDAVFQQGDILALRSSNGFFTEVHREQSL